MNALALIFLAVSVGANVPTEAERCARTLTGTFDRHVDARRALIASDDYYVEVALARMKRAGDLRDQDREAALRAQMKLGAIFAREGLVHEAIHQTFIGRFETARRAREALLNFKHLSSARDQGVLVAEVIERTLQFVPDVTVGNVFALGPRAAFLNLDPTQLRDLRDRWRIYDQNDQFAELLQGAVHSILTAADPQLVASVEARGGLLRRLFARASGPALPIPPKPGDPAATPRAIAFENAAYFETAEVLAYLEASSMAARQYFVMISLDHLNLEQLRAVDRAGERWALKPSLRVLIADRIAARAPWLEKSSELNEARALARELDRALDHEDRARRYDRAAIQAHVGALWRITAAPLATLEATAVLDRVAADGSPAQYVGVVVSVRDATMSRVGGQSRFTRELIERVVRHANALGVDDAQFRKIESVFGAWIDRLPAAERTPARVAAARLERRLVTLPPLNPPALERRRDETARRIDALEREIAGAWQSQAPADVVSP